jgi:hypothetical protein
VATEQTRLVTNRAPSASIFELAEKHLRLRETAGALAAFSKAETLGFDPDACSGGRWICHMLDGNFELAWQESDRIARRGRPDPHRFWDGRPLHGNRVLLRCLHGLGDTLQFIRYAPLIRARASCLIIEAQPALKQLITVSKLADQVITWGESEPAWDQQVEIMELPRIFRTTLRSIPNEMPYLRIPGDSAERQNRNGKLRAGLVWTSSTYNEARSVPLNVIEPVLSVPGVEFFSFQAGEARSRGREFGLVDLCDESDLVSVARRVDQMDLIITVDTMMAHLAGALGKPVWTMLPCQADWRWMMERSDSPWYPTMRLFRQTVPGQWTSVVDRVQTKLLNAVQTFRDSAR